MTHSSKAPPRKLATNIDSNFASCDNWVSVVNEKLDLILDTEKIAFGMQDQWEENEELTSLEKRRNPEETASTLVDVFVLYLDMCIIPPPEILLAMCEMFQTYFTYQGNVSLEDVFFGSKQRCVGNYSARREAKYNIYFRFHMGNMVNKMAASSLEPDSEVERAEEFLTKEAKRYKDSGYVYDAPDLDTFLRQYRRWKKRQADNKRF